MSNTDGRVGVWLEPETRRFRWYAPNGSRKSKPIPNYDSLDAKQIENLRSMLEITLNNGGIDPFTGIVITTSMTMSQLWAHYEQNQLSNLRGQTAACYETVWRLYIEPCWGATRIGAIKTVEVEKWLCEVGLQNGKLASKEYKAKIRNTMSAMFTHALRYDLANHNPISCGGSDIGRGGKRGSAAGVRLLGEFTEEREVVHFLPLQVVQVLEKLSLRDRLLVLLDGVLGLRRGELGGLHWEDCSLETNQFVIRHSFDWKTGRENPPKTEASAARLPMHPVLKDALLEWRKQTPYTRPIDYVFASHRLHGKKPVDLKEVFVKTIRPVIEQLGFARPGAQYGWHAFRHGVGTALWDLTRDKLTVRDLLRHSREAVTDRYMHGIDQRLVDAQDKLVIAMGLKAPNPAAMPQRREWGRRMPHRRHHLRRAFR
jgi:integrase